MIVSELDTLVLVVAIWGSPLLKVIKRNFIPIWMRLAVPPTIVARRLDIVKFELIVCPDRVCPPRYL